MPPLSHYQDLEGRRYHEQKRGIPPAALPWICRARAGKFQPYVEGADVVYELGVGSGWNLATLKCKLKLGWDAADFLRPAIEAGGIQFTPINEVPDNSVDVVICHHTLEHLLNPPESLGEMRRILKPAGKLLLHVPYEKERRYRTFNAMEPNHHLYSWNVQTLGNLLVEIGFKIEAAQIGLFGYDRFAANLAFKFHLGETGFKLIRMMAHLLRPGSEVQIRATIGDFKVYAGK